MLVTCCSVLSAMAMSAGPVCICVVQDYFPEHLGTMFIINAPMIFSAIWAVVNPLLEERTRKKIMVLG